MRTFISTKTQKLLSLLFAFSLVIGTLGFPVNADSAITLTGTCHVQDYGDTDGVWDASTGTLTLGTRGQAKRVEAITIYLENNTGLSGTLEYRVHVQDIGWQDYRTAGEMAGTSGQAKRLEGIEMNLTGDLAAAYTVEYAVHIQDYGDAQGFVSDGTLAGTTGESKRLEEVRIRIVPRGQGTSTTVNYRVHRQDYGWESVWKTNGQSSGTVGESKRLEGIEIHLSGNEYSGGIKYRTHVQNIGWESSWSQNGEMSGTQGYSYRLEAIQIELTGDIANYYDVYYRVHAQDYGWLGWAKNGEESGTSGLAKRLEAIQIVLVKKGNPAPGDVNGIVSTTNAIAVDPEGYIYSSNNNGGSPTNEGSGTPSGGNSNGKSTLPSFTVVGYYLKGYAVTDFGKGEMVELEFSTNTQSNPVTEFGIYCNENHMASEYYLLYYVYADGSMKLIPTVKGYQLDGYAIDGSGNKVPVQFYHRNLVVAVTKFEKYCKDNNLVMGDYTMTEIYTDGTTKSAPTVVQYEIYTSAYDENTGEQFALYFTASTSDDCHEQMLSWFEEHPEYFPGSYVINAVLSDGSHKPA